MQGVGEKLLKVLLNELLGRVINITHGDIIFIIFKSSLLLGGSYDKVILEQ